MLRIAHLSDYHLSIGPRASGPADGLAQAIVADSTVPGSPAGHLGVDQLAWIDTS